MNGGRKINDEPRPNAPGKPIEPPPEDQQDDE